MAERSSSWYSACLRITRNPQLAEDAVQDGLLNAWKNRHQFKESAKLTTWIHSICVNSALTLLRKKQPDSYDATELEFEDPSATTEETHFRGELQNELESAMQKLTHDERVCFVLRHLEQWNLKEIAREIGKNDNAVKQSIFRAVQKLRTSMPALAGEAR